METREKIINMLTMKNIHTFLTYFIVIFIIFLFFYIFGLNPWVLLVVLIILFLLLLLPYFQKNGSIVENYRCKNSEWNEEDENIEEVKPKIIFVSRRFRR